MKKVYASILGRLIEQGVSEAEALEKLLAHLKARGRTKLLTGIHRELSSALLRRKKSAQVIEVASEEEVPAALRSAKEYGISAPSALINPALIRGWRARSATTLVDHSGKRALLELYRRIVKA